MANPNTAHFGAFIRSFVSGTENFIRLSDPDAGTDLFRINAAGNVKAGNIIKGTMAMPLSNAHLLAFQNIAASGGVLATDTNPALTSRNAATDPTPRISWAASNAAVIRLDAVVPDDIDLTVPGVLTIIGSMAGASDTPTMAAHVFVGVGGTDLGGTTAAFSSATQTLSLTLAAWPTTAAGQPITVTLTPGAHTTDILRLDGARVRYTRM